MAPRHTEADRTCVPARLKKRPDFLRVAGGRKAHAALFTVQALGRPAADDDDARVGFTVTKKVGGAVERNRIKRRLRELVRVAPGLQFATGHDYVIVARRAVLETPFAALKSGLVSALAKVHGPKRTPDVRARPDRDTR